MHNSVLFGVWACVSFVLYKIVAAVLEERRHAKNARELGCEPTHNPNGWDIWGVVAVWKMLQADKKALFPAHIKQRFEDATKAQNRQINTLSSPQLGSPFLMTTEPKNIQAMLATQFKDYGLGERRNVNFFPLLGHGIVSMVEQLYLIINLGCTTLTRTVLFRWQTVGTQPGITATAICTRPSQRPGPRRRARPESSTCPSCRKGWMDRFC